MPTLSTKSFVIRSWAVTSLLLCTAAANALEPIESLGKQVFFDESLSTPSNKQACASCHDPAKGWVLPNSAINRTTVVAPGAAPHALGNIKSPANAYASLSPIFQTAPGFGNVLPAWAGGNFWDGRAEGCGAKPGTKCPVPPDVGGVSETVTPADLPVSKQSAYTKYLGPTTDQALNPFPNTVEQNIREKKVCNQVKTAKYKALYDQAFGEPIDCNPNPAAKPSYRTSFKRIAVAVAAWQKSPDVVSFSSKRDKALKSDPKFPLVGFTPEENLGHDLFYGIPPAKNAGCAFCHNGLEGQVDSGFPLPPADPTGEHPRQLYTDHRYHHIGVPYNREIPGVAKGAKKGLAGHVVAANVLPGFFKTPTLRNVAKGVGGGFTKAYGHNGYFKSLEGIVHFYNTRDAKPSCESLGIANATEKEALAKGCWPRPEFDNGVFVGAPVVGNLGLTPQEEKAIVAYLKTLSDQHTPSKP